MKRLAFAHAGQRQESLVQSRARRRVGGSQIDRRAAELFEPEIGARVEPDHFHMLFDHAR